MSMNVLINILFVGHQLLGRKIFQAIFSPATYRPDYKSVGRSALNSHMKGKKHLNLWPVLEAQV